MSERAPARKKSVMVAVAIALLFALDASARGQEQVTIGLYAPTAPFRGPSERLEYISSLASHLAPAARGRRVVGRVFVRASSFVAAVKRGEVQFAVVDAPYAAARGLPYEVLATATRNGQATVPWMLVASSGIGGLAELYGAVVALPQIGARGDAFLAHSLLEGEVESSWFSQVTTAPDTFSALTLVSVGRARAAFVPAGVALPSGVARVLELRAVGWPMFVALPRTDKELVDAFRERVLGFTGKVLTGFTAASAGDYQTLRASFGKRRRRGPMALPRGSQNAVRELFGGRQPRIRMSELDRLLSVTEVAGER